MRFPKRGTVPREDGFTLVELLISSMLSVVVLGIVGAIIINSLQAERTVREENEAASQGQLVARSITNGVRNSSNLSLTLPASGTQLLRARVVGSGPTATWSCQSWYFGAGEIRTKTAEAAIPVPTATDVASWTLLASGVSVVGATPVLASSGLRADLSYYVSTGAGRPVLFTTSAISRQPLGTGVESPTCF